MLKTNSTSHTASSLLVCYQCLTSSQPKQQPTTDSKTKWYMEYSFQKSYFLSNTAFTSQWDPTQLQQFQPQQHITMRPHTTTTVSTSTTHHNETPHNYNSFNLNNTSQWDPTQLQQFQPQQHITMRPHTTTTVSTSTTHHNETPHNYNSFNLNNSIASVCGRTARLRQDLETIIL